MRRLFLAELLPLLLFFTLPLNAENKVIAIETENVSLIMGANRNNVLHTFYFGEKINSASEFEPYVSGNRETYGYRIMSYPTQGGRNTIEPALVVRYSDGYMNTELYYLSHRSFNVSDDVKRTEIITADPVTGLEVKLIYDAFVCEDVIVTHSEITNNGQGEVELINFYSSSLALQDHKYVLGHFNGEWAGEMQFEQEPLTHGIKVIETKEGAKTTHKESPSFILGIDGDSIEEDSGKVLVGTLAWSGNFKLSFQMTNVETVNILAGINPYCSQYPLAKGQCFVTPEMIYTYSTCGLGQASRNLHDWSRNHLERNAKEMCPTLLNSWEGAYFNFNTRTLTDMIDDAASLGLEMFVLDDGWFGSDYPRDDDTQGLGDWEVNTAKIPEGIDYIASYAHSKGLLFGIWIEPEMLNPKSNLAQEHPDWVVKSVGREIYQSRKQWNLDLSNPEVQDFVFGVFDRTASLSKNIDYIKWDCNKAIMSFGSEYLGKEQSRFYIDYVQGYYNVLRRIREKYPDIMIQNCSSGGGRVEYGSLRYTDEIWPSDNTDAVCRTRIQYGTSILFPAHIMATEISDVPNHQTGNVTPLKFRCDLASTGRFGMEIQPKNFSTPDLDYMKRCLETYKGFRDIILEGDLYRISSPFDSDFYSLMYVSKDKKRAVAFVFCLKYQNDDKIQRFALKGLSEEMNYTVSELNTDTPIFWGSGRSFSGNYLVRQGLNLKMKRIYDSAVFLLESDGR